MKLVMVQIINTTRHSERSEESYLSLLANFLDSQVERDSSPTAQNDIRHTPFLVMRDRYKNQ